MQRKPTAASLLYICRDVYIYIYNTQQNNGTQTRTEQKRKWRRFVHICQWAWRESAREKKSLSFPLCYYSMNISHLTSPMRTYTHTHAYDMLKHRRTCFLSLSLALHQQACRGEKDVVVYLLLEQSGTRTNERANEQTRRRKRKRNKKNNINFWLFLFIVWRATIDINERRGTVVSLSGLEK